MLKKKNKLRKCLANRQIWTLGLVHDFWFCFFFRGPTPEVNPELSCKRMNVMMIIALVIIIASRLSGEKHFQGWSTKSMSDDFFQISLRISCSSTFFLWEFMIACFVFVPPKSQAKTQPQTQLCDPWAKRRSHHHFWSDLKERCAFSLLKSAFFFCAHTPNRLKPSFRFRFFFFVVSKKISVQTDFFFGGGGFWFCQGTGAFLKDGLFIIGIILPRHLQKGDWCSGKGLMGDLRAWSETWKSPLVCYKQVFGFRRFDPIVFRSQRHWTLDLGFWHLEANMFWKANKHGGWNNGFQHIFSHLSRWPSVRRLLFCMRWLLTATQLSDVLRRINLGAF